MSTVGVYIGRFQPFHNGHKSVVDKMLADGNSFNYILLGGPNNPRDRDNPFDVDERETLIHAAYDYPEMIVTYSPNNPDDNLWAAGIRNAVGDDEYKDFGETYVLYGAYSDASSFYLDLFPEWEKRLTVLDNSYLTVHATQIRHWIRMRDWAHVKRHVPEGTFNYLRKLVETEPDTCHKWLQDHDHELIASH